MPRDIHRTVAVGQRGTETCSVIAAGDKLREVAQNPLHVEIRPRPADTFAGLLDPKDVRREAAYDA